MHTHTRGCTDTATTSRSRVLCSRKLWSPGGAVWTGHTATTHKCRQGCGGVTCCHSCGGGTVSVGLWLVCSHLQWVVRSRMAPEAGEGRSQINRDHIGVRIVSLWLPPSPGHSTAFRATSRGPVGGCNTPPSFLKFSSQWRPRKPAKRGQRRRRGGLSAPLPRLFCSPPHIPQHDQCNDVAILLRGACCRQPPGPRRRHAGHTSIARCS